MNKITLITFLSLFLGACSTSKYIPDVSLPDFSWSSISSFKPYKSDIPQGSVLRRFTINQLEIGMSKHQVQRIIGQPSIIDPFHRNQWDYIHYTTLGSGDIVSYRLILTFTKEGLSNINTDGIGSLPEMTDKEKEQEVARIAERKRLEVVRIAREIARKAAQAKIVEERRIAKVKEEVRVAKEKADGEVKEKAKKEAETKIEEENRLAKERSMAKIKEENRLAEKRAEQAVKAKIEAENRLAKERARIKVEEENRAAKAKEAARIAKEKIEAKKLEESKPWYKF